MKNRKPYTPTMPKRKLKNLTLITEKNIGKVMGQLNHFFSKPTLYLSGFSPKVIGYRTDTWGNDCFKYEIYSDELYPYYIPYPGKCNWHYLWKEYLAGRNILFSRKKEDIPRLAIEGKYSNGCIPIEIGDAYKIYGNRLVIMHKWDKFIHHTPWLRFTEFISISEYEPNDLKNIQVSGCILNFSDSIYDLRDGYDRRYFDYLNDLANKISYHLENVLRTKSEEEKVEICLSHIDENFTLVIYPKKALDFNNNENYAFIIDSKGEKYESPAKFAMGLTDKKIAEDFEAEKELEKESKYFNLDYDFEDWDLSYEDL